MTTYPALQVCRPRSVRVFSTSARVLLLMMGMGVAIGCAKSKPKTDDAEKAASGQQTVESEQGADPVSSALRAIAENCTINEQHAVVSKCKSNEKQRLVRQLNAGKVSRAEALPLLVNALGAEDKKLSIAASKTLEGAYRNSFGDVGTDGVDAQVAKNLLEQVGKLPKRQAMQVAPAAVHAAVLSGQTQELYKVLDEHPNKDMRASAYVYLMRYASLDQLPKIKDLVEGEDARVAASALESLRRMPGQTDEQKAQICDFVSPWVSDPRPSVAGKAVSLSSTCGGKYVDVALAEAEKRAAGGDLSAAFVRGFDQLCLDRRGKTYGTGEQCKRERRWLEAVLAKKALGEDVRQFALLGLGLQFPDDKTAALANTYAAADEKRLKSAAQRVARSVASKQKRGQAVGATAAKGPGASQAKPTPASKPSPAPGVKPAGSAAGPASK